MTTSFHKPQVCLIDRFYRAKVFGGGISSYTHHMTKAFTSVGCDVHVVSEGTKDNSSQTVFDSGIYIHLTQSGQFYNTKNKNIARFWEQFNFAIAVNKKIRSLENKIKFDVIEAPEYGFPGILLSSWQHCLVTRLHTPSFLVRHWNGAVSKSYVDKLTDQFEAKQVAMSASIVSPSRSLAEIIIQRWMVNLSKIHIVPNVFDKEVLLNTLGKTYVLPLGIAKYVLYYGRLEGRKGVITLAYAMRSVLALRLDIQFVVVGSDLGCGLEMKNILSQFESRTFFLNPLAGHDLWTIVQGAECIVVPSKWENFPYTCLEAMALGKIIVGTKGSGIAEIIKDGVSGLLVEPENQVSLAQAIEKVLVMARKEKAEMEKRARKKVEDYSIISLTKMIAEAYPSKNLAKILLKNLS